MGGKEGIGEGGGSSEVCVYDEHLMFESSPSDVSINC